MALDFLHDNFEFITTTILEKGNKTIDEIQHILFFAEAKLISKQATGIIQDLAMISVRQNTNKRRATIDNKCFNCQRMRHFGRDCIALSACKKNKIDKSSSNNNG